MIQLFYFNSECNCSMWKWLKSALMEIDRKRIAKSFAKVELIAEYLFKKALLFYKMNIST